MNICVLTVPYDSGQWRARMGRGPQYLLESGLVDALHEQGHTLRVETIEVEGFPAEIATAFRLYRSLAEHVHAAAGQGDFPLILSGNCGAALGGLAGVDPAQTGMIWLDAHGDFNTPETTTSGFLDGMGLAVAAGRCWRTLAGTIPGFMPVPEANIVHVGARDLDPAERAAFDASDVAVVTAERIRQAGIRAALGPAIAALAQRVRRVYLHLDIDVLDSDAIPTNQFYSPGGLSAEQVEEVIGLIGEHLDIAAAGIAAYDPDYDREDRAVRAAFGFVKKIVSAG